MSSLERQLTELINGVETPISPMTDSSTIYYNSKKLSDILPSVNPITLTKAEYEAKVEAGEITDESEEVYYVIDDIDGFTI